MRRLSQLACAALGCALAFSANAQKDEYPLPPKEWPAPVMDSMVIPLLLIDRLEYRSQKGQDVRAWDVQGWIGGDHNKLWLKSEGEAPVGGRVQQASLEALYARLISPFWYLQTGVRHEARPSPSRNAVALGVQGLAPYWFDVETTAYLNEKGKFSARFEGEYDLLFTQRLILQPRLETGIAASAEPERGMGRGVTDLSLGLRLRYEIRRQFAPYVGVTWSRKLGDTADLARRAGVDVTELAVVAGLRIWF